jgi:hypothetical protein
MPEAVQEATNPVRGAPGDRGLLRAGFPEAAGETGSAPEQ